MESYYITVNTVMHVCILITPLTFLRLNTPHFIEYYFCWLGIVYSVFPFLAKKIASAAGSE